jgi:hypothetical protein
MLKRRAEGLSRLNEAGLGTPALLTAARASILPHVILIGEEDSLVTTTLTDGLDGSNLLLLTGASSAVAVTASGPTALEVDDDVTGADVAEDGELARDELTGGLGADLGVEVGVDVGTSDVDNVADGRRNIGSLPDVESLGNGPAARVARALLLDSEDKLSELRRRTEAVHNGLVTDNEELDHVPLSPLSKRVDLLLDLGNIVGAAASLDKDTNNHVHTVLSASGANSLEGVAVSGVDTDDAEASVLEGLDIGIDGISGLAVTVAGLIGSVGDTVMVVAALEVAGAAAADLLGGGSVRNLGLGGGSGNLNNGLLGRRGLDDSDLGRRRLDNGDLGRRGLDDNLGGGKTLLSVRADVDEVGLGNGDNLLRSTVGAGNDGGWDGVNDNSLLGDGLGDRSNRVGTGGGADVDGGLNNVGNDAVAGGLLGVRASNCGGSLDDGGDTADGVCSGNDLDGLLSADGGGFANGDSGSGESISSGGRACVNLRSRDNDNDLGGHGRSRDDDLAGGGRRRGRSGSRSLLGRLRSEDSSASLGGSAGHNYIRSAFAGSSDSDRIGSYELARR